MTDIQYRWGAEKIKTILFEKGAFDSLSRYSLRPLNTSETVTRYVIGKCYSNL